MWFATPPEPGSYMDRLRGVRDLWPEIKLAPPVARIWDPKVYDVRPGVTVGDRVDAYRAFLKRIYTPAVAPEKETTMNLDNAIEIMEGQCTDLNASEAEAAQVLDALRDARDEIRRWQSTCAVADAKIRDLASDLVDLLAFVGGPELPPSGSTTDDALERCRIRVARIRAAVRTTSPAEIVRLSRERDDAREKLNVSTRTNCDVNEAIQAAFMALGERAPTTFVESIRWLGERILMVRAERDQIRAKYREIKADVDAAHDAKRAAMAVIGHQEPVMLADAIRILMRRQWSPKVMADAIRFVKIHGGDEIHGGGVVCAALDRAFELMAQPVYGLSAPHRQMVVSCTQDIHGSVVRRLEAVIERYNAVCALARSGR